MKVTTSSPEFLHALGQLVVDFGFMERAIRSSIIILVRDAEVARALVPPTNAVSQNLDLLRRACLIKVKEPGLDTWLEAIDDLKLLFEERNRIFHGMFYEDNDRVILSRIVKRGRGKPDEVITFEYEPEKLVELHRRINSRRRQLMDFADDYYDSENGPANRPMASQDDHPFLTYGE
ncbi:hypothetical protein [Aquipseudomonas alcaligenes]|uniref:hypothetical protein n=1 Tax=Aquipseudomonas alcaligenes TaxID=43263 RepID=UPI00111592F2|nr:hypothetical protein [Pseudomonas alcaligenes]